MKKNKNSDLIDNYYVDKVIQKFQFNVDKQLSDFIVCQVYKTTGETVFTINPNEIAKAIKKRTAKKVLAVDLHGNVSENVHRFVCPTCHNFLAGRRTVEETPELLPGYCCVCGQKIDWKFEKSQKPMFDGNVKLYMCPICHNYLAQGDNCCDECGQKLDWSEVTE